MRRLLEHLPEYAIEGALLGLFMLSACSFCVLLEHPDSPVHRAIGDPLLRRALMGMAMGGTAIAIIYSPWGGRSGAHINPATTLTFWRLGRVHGSDVAGYIGGQLVGAVLGVALASVLLGGRVAHASVDFVVTRPGRWGTGAAFLAEVLISAVLMAVVVTLTGSRWARYTGLVVGALVATYITVEAPISGMSMNPARSFGSAWGAGDWGMFWVYLTAPLVGMNLGAFLAMRVGARPACPKFHHPESQRCIFCGHAPAARLAARTVPASR
ncbi:MAG TPA: aquaporin [Myxococcaceae bacterium]|nr:aquaporin [Myxococcaceae bacterium]